MKKQNSRIEIIDLTRGALIALMIIAHGIVFFDKNHTPYLWAINQVIDLMAFVGLLFLSGVATYHAYLNRSFTKSDWRIKQKHIFVKLLQLLFGYYLVGFTANIGPILSGDSDIALRTIAKILVFVDVPGFAEFLIPFIFYYAVTILFRKQLATIVKSAFWFWAIIFFVTILGNVLAYYPLPIGRFEVYQQLLAGDPGLYRFPILQYFPVFLLGAYWSSTKQWIDKNPLIKEFRWPLVVGLAIALVALKNLLLKGSLEFDPNRWPPNIEFLLLALFANFLLIIVITFLSHAFKKNRLKPLSYIGKRAFLYYFYHIILLNLYTHLSGIDYALGPILAVVFTIALFALTALLVHIFHSIEVVQNWLYKIRRLAFPVFYVLAFGVAAFYGYQLITNTKSADLPVATIEQKLTVEDFTFVSKIDRRWILKDATQPLNYTSLNYTVKLEEPKSYYKFVSLKLDGETFVTTKRSNDHNYDFSISAFKLEPGEHTLQLLIEDTEIGSEISNFNVSYPLYATWTLDHEGYDISDGNINAINRISEKYDMPLTILATPRIYVVSDISDARAKKMTDWMLDRYQNHNAEIGLHLHMHLDMINAADLSFPAKTAPRWGGRANGHDVLNYAYNYEEYDEIIKWALTEFKTNGLPRPVTYRAGGWFMGLDNLKVVEANGFVVDTSGRDAFTWGSNNVKNPWNLKNTTKPFIPAWNDQNKVGTPGNTFTSLWEFPNNGSDSTNNTYEVMKARFDENFNGSTLNEGQTITFMSHPHWFTTYDEPKMDKLLHEVSKYKISDDNGPVVFSTIVRAYQFWK